MPENSRSCLWCGTPFKDGAETCSSCRAARVPAVPELVPGGVIDTKYEIEGLLGVGGMGEVYRARHVHLGTARTIKVLRRALTADEAFRARFVREARTATLVQHPNVAMLHDFATLSDGSYYMVSELIEGQTLRQWSAANGRFPVELAVEIATQTLRGLESIHRAGLLHRDISSDNIMISGGAHPVAKIIDLGIAKVVRGRPGAAVTQAGLFVGNPRYASPEQLGALPDGEQLDERADLYCLGVVLYEMIAGVPPFTSPTPDGYVAKHLLEPPPPIVTIEGLAGVSDALQRVIFVALEKNRIHRYRTAGEFIAALRPFRSLPAESTWAGVLAGLPSAARETVSSAREKPDPRQEDPGTQSTPPPALPSPRQPQARRPELTPGEKDECTIATEPPPSRAPVAATPSAVPGGGDQERSAVHLARERPAPALPEPESVLGTPSQVEAPSPAAPVGESPAASVSRAPAEAAAEIPRANARAPVPAAAPVSRRTGGVALAAGSALLVLLLFGWVLARTSGPGQAHPEVEAENASVTSPARLEIDALPWARIESVRDEAGRLMAVQNSATPLRLDLAPGRYDVAATGPGGRTRRTRTVELRAGETRRITIDFTRPEDR